MKTKFTPNWFCGFEVQTVPTETLRYNASVYMVMVYMIRVYMVRVFEFIEVFHFVLLINTYRAAWLCAWFQHAGWKRWVPIATTNLSLNHFHWCSPFKTGSAPNGNHCLVWKGHAMFYYTA